MLFKRNCQKCLQEVALCYTYIIYERSSCSISLLTFGIVSSLNFSHFNVCEFISHGAFNVSFSDYWSCWTTFYVWPVDILFCEVSHLEKLKLLVYLIFQVVGTSHVFCIQVVCQIHVLYIFFSGQLLVYLCY